MRNMKVFVFLKWFKISLLLTFFSLNAEEIKVPLKEFVFVDPTLRGTQSEINIKLPIPSRYEIKDLRIHLEVEKSASLIKERSSISIFFNKKLVYQRAFDPLIDIMTVDAKLPSQNLEPYNDLVIRAIHHYCLNCCEFEGSPELWSRVDLENSYIYIEYSEKPILPDTLLIRDYVLDPKMYNPLDISILTENNDDFYISMAAKLAGFIGNFIKYRKIRISYISDIVKDRDIFLIGRKEFIKKILGPQLVNVPDVGIVPNPLNFKKGLIIISGDNQESIKRNLYAFMSIKRELYIGSEYYIKSTKIENLQEYSNLVAIPLGEKVYLNKLGYEDFKFNGIFPPPAIIEFRIPQGLFIEKNKKVIFHIAYNYGAGTRDDSVINIYLNDRYITSLKMQKRYGVVLQEEDIKIPAYLLHGGINKLKVEYAMVPSGGGFCISPNTESLRGTLFSTKSFIEIPKMPMWFEMPYLEHFIETAFPYSLEGGLADTTIYITSKNERYISSVLNLSAYIGTKIFLPPYELEVSSKLENLGSKNLILIGDKIPPNLQKNSSLKITEDKIDATIPLLKEVFNGNMFKKIFGIKTGDLSEKANILFSNRIINQVFFIMSKSPFDSQKTVMFIYSKNPEYLYRTISSLFEPKFASQIRGDISIVDFHENLVYSDNINDKYYIGNLPLWKKIMYSIGFSPTVFALFTVFIVVLTSLILKRILDTREKKRLEGEI